MGSTGPCWRAAFDKLQKGSPESYITMLDYMGDRLDVDSGRQLTEFALSNEKLTRKDSHA